MIECRRHILKQESGELDGFYYYTCEKCLSIIAKHDSVSYDDINGYFLIIDSSWAPLILTCDEIIIKAILE